MEPLAAAKELNFANPELRPALATIAESLLAQDRAAFESWAESLPDPEVRNTVRGIAMTRDALTDPAKAAQDTAAWLASDPAAAASAGVLSGHIAQHWWQAKASPRVVGDWAASLPAGPAQDAAVGAVGRLWLEQDTIAASGWMNGLAAGPGRDAAVRRLIQTIQQETPDDAFAWAATLHDAGLRRELLRESTTRWAMKDHEAALSAVEKLPIGNRGELQEILSKVQFMGE